MSVAIYQISYNDDVVDQKDEVFLNFDCRDDPAPDRREIHHMLKFYRSGAYKESTYSGLFSPKFSAKAKISGKQFIDFIEANPGYDVYFVNPFPHLTYFNFNVWEQGELVSPGLCDLANEVLKAAGHSVDVRALPRNKADTALYCNFWVGNERFWDEFMRFISGLDAGIELLPEVTRAQVFGKAPYLTLATYYPFIFERMFSTFLLFRRDLAVLPYPCPREEFGRYYFSEMEELLIREWGTMIETWDAAGVYAPDKRRVFGALMKICYLYASAKVRLSSVGL